VVVAAYHPPPLTPMAAIDWCARRAPLVSLGGPLEWPGRLKCIPTPSEGGFGILDGMEHRPAGVSILPVCPVAIGTLDA
jgi:hypothetical protein